MNLKKWTKHNATVTFWNDFTEMDVTEQVLYINDITYMKF